MRTIGNIIMVQLMALFGCGFLVAYSLNITQELTETKEQLAQTQMELRTLEAQYQAVIEEKKQLKEQIMELTSENTDLLAKVESLEVEKQILSDKIFTIQNKLEILEKNNPVLTWLASSPAKYFTVLFVLPIVPISFGTAYVISYQKKKKAFQAHRMNNQRENQSTVLTKLTRDEFHIIAQYRRYRSYNRQINKLGPKLLDKSY